MRLPFTVYAVQDLLLFAVLWGGAAALCIAAGWWWLAPIPLALLAFTLNFFRDPERVVPGDERTVVSPADGTVADLSRVDHAPFVEGPAVRIGIFLSVFDVHVNRMPLAGTVRCRVHKPGRYLDARDPRVGQENEAMEVGVEAVGPDGRPFRLLLRQVAGAIARRIVCPVVEGRAYARGERFGMIKYGSYTELFLPEGAVDGWAVQKGAKVKGGATVLARLAVPTRTPAAAAARAAS
ncbi:MAG TPA: phosphatidylserine decarboxylase [Planctomycetota bacterium]|nr:phosphatidylserine decarboxylase [Planctomycetota bacterium]